MEKFEKIPLGWIVVNEDDTFKLLDLEGKVRSSVVYRIEEEDSGIKFIEIISVASGKEQGKGYYGILYSGLESFARTERVAYFCGFIKPENVRSLQVHEHLGFFPINYLNYGNEKRTVVRKNISI